MTKVIFPVTRLRRYLSSVNIVAFMILLASCHGYHRVKSPDPVIRMNAVGNWVARGSTALTTDLQMASA